MADTSDQMGLVNSGTATGAAAGLRQLIMDQLARQERERTAALEERKMSLQERIAQGSEEDRKARQAELAQEAAARMQSQHDVRAAAGQSALPVGDNIASDSFTKNYANTPSADAFAPQVSLAAKQTAGLSPLDTSEAGASSTTQAPRTLTGRMVNLGTDKQQESEQKKQILGRLISGLPEGSRERMALEYEQGTGKNAPTGLFDPKAPSSVVQVDEGGKPVYRNVADAVGKPAYRQPPQVSTVTIQTVDENGRKVTKVVPKSEAIGQSYAAAPSGATETRLASAQAVKQTGDDIVKQLSDPAVAKTLGPALGRYTTLQDFIGNPPPEFSELAGSIESYALASMGVHGMRSAQGAEQIKKLLTAKHTPESLKASITGLSKFATHFMQNEGRGGATTEPAGPQQAKPTAEDLIKKYGGGD